jgi:hypothetical protein
LIPALSLLSCSELEVQRREKIKSRIAELEIAKRRAAAQRQREADGVKDKDTDKEKEKEKEKVEEDSDETREAKRRRLQVLASLSDGHVLPEPMAVPAGPIRVGLSQPIVAAQPAKRKLAFGGATKDDEEREEQERLREREETLRKLREESEQEKATESASGGPVLHQLEDEESLEDIHGGKRKKSALPGSVEATISNISQTIQSIGGVGPSIVLPAAVLAQAQALSAQVAQRTDAINLEKDKKEREKEIMQKVIARIPSER